jgi:hypothetical protein
MATTPVIPRPLNRKGRAEQVLGLRIQGHSCYAIAKMVGTSVSAVSRLIDRHVAANPIPNAEQLIVIELEKLDADEAAFTQIRNNACPSFDERGQPATDADRIALDTALAAHDRVMKIRERRAKLLALDQPKKIDVTIPESITHMDQERLAAAVAEGLRRVRRAPLADQSRDVEIAVPAGRDRALARPEATDA